MAEENPKPSDLDDPTAATPSAPAGAEQPTDSTTGDSPAPPASGAPPAPAMTDVEAQMAAMLQADAATQPSGDSAAAPAMNDVEAQMAAMLEADSIAAEAAPASPAPPRAPEPPTRPFVAPDLAARADATATASIDLLDDVELNVAVELGRTEMYIEDVLRLGVGSVVELDRLAGDPVDIYVNDRLVARGEVLVLNDNFCVRVNDIVCPNPEAEPAR